MKREYWECDRCGRHLLKGERGIARYNVVAVNVAVGSMPRLDVVLCAGCYSQVEGVIKYGKVARLPEPIAPGPAE